MTGQERSPFNLPFSIATPRRNPIRLALLTFCSYLDGVLFLVEDSFLAAHYEQHSTMSLPLAVIVVIVIALVAGALALSAFVWAIRTKQFSIQQLNKGAYLVFDEDEPAGVPQDMIFLKPGTTHGEETR
jgi:cbb3-type cytochrome oxidase maturation protein